MAWIKSHQTLPRHPKTRRLVRALNISTATACGHLHLLWWWALDYAQDGDLSSYENADLADAAQWEGDADQFVMALLSAGGDKPGFLEATTNGYRLHDWDDYAGDLLRKRAANAERMKAKRKGVQPTKRERATHVQRTEDARADDVQDTSRRVQGLEKRREEKSLYREINPKSNSADFAAAQSVERETEAAFEEWYAEFKKVYPARNGRRVGIDSAAKEQARRLTASERGLCLKATKRYGESGEIPCDPIRWFKSDEFPKGRWREWVLVKSSTAALSEYDDTEESDGVTNISTVQPNRSRGGAPRSVSKQEEQGLAVLDLFEQRAQREATGANHRNGHS